ncbi:type II toxin-antitoxin system HicB family antitoxin [Lysinibacillus xylanilyticus]|uniref:type II toxin-antitoxin system HicB family antitoxin n=1 Tax=Lysinibacillus xylanilyticus TaxID=582475 RepID=UPI002B242D90|nr:type II toxin-antitoxin system HicB family antitoxin [Lysinibacillus xylanilyticus]MEB2280179.1 type II toxin-antitoxin system HicB family antitoxin [Lysinibacillus xylanilyticus]
MIKKVYPAIFTTDPVGFDILFPDVEGAVTQGEDITDGLEMASDVLGIMLADLIERGENLPEPTPLNDVKFDKGTQFVTLVSVELSEYLKMNEPVKKTLQIPKWADKIGQEMKINFSQTLTEAIAEKATKKRA